MKTIALAILAILVAAIPSHALEIVLLVDESGSMEDVRDDTIGGMKSFKRTMEQQHPDANLIISTFSTNLRDGHINEYSPQGGTALYDAVGLTVDKLQERVTPEDAVIIAILTDGKENRSTKFSQAAIKWKIEHWSKWHPWTFLYLSSSPDAWEDSGSIGISDGTFTIGISDGTFTIDTSDAAGIDSSFTTAVDAVGTVIEGIDAETLIEIPPGTVD